MISNRMVTLVIALLSLTTASPGAAQSLGEDQRQLVTYGNQVLDFRSFFASKAMRFMMVDRQQPLFWVASTSTGETLLEMPAGASTPSNGTPVLDFGKRAFQWPRYHHPSGSFFFVSDVANDEQLNVYRFDPKSRAISRLTQVDLGRMFNFSGDLAEVVYTGRVGAPGAPFCVRRVAVDDPGTDRVVACDQGAQGEFQITDFYPPTVSPTNRYTAVTLTRHNNRSDLYLGLVDMERQVLLPIVEPGAERRNMVYPLGWDGDTLYFAEQDGQRQALIAYRPDQGVREVLWTLPATAPQLGKEGAYDPLSKRIMLATKEPAGQPAGGTTTVLRIFDLTTRQELAKVDAGAHRPEWVSGVQVLRDGSFAMIATSPGRKTPYVVGISLARGEEATLDVLFSPGEAEAVPACPTEIVTYPTFDSLADGSPRMIEAVLFLPPNGRRPTAGLIYAHGGPTEQTTTAWNFQIQLACHLGYAVLGPNPRGSSGYGKDFEDLNNGDWGGGDLADYEYGRRYLVNRFAFEERRVGIFGHSYGGYVTQMAVTRADNRFGFGIALSAPSDLIDIVRTSTIGPFIRGEMGDPETWTKLYEERSPINQVERLQVPLLVAHGASDNRVPTAQSRRFAEVARGLGRDVTYLELAGEGHQLQYVSTAKDFAQAMLDLLYRLAPPQHD